ncbi:Uncharacterised protein [Mycobacteroides abscessus subsp. bolletii]|nr:Uncharacterised protein [Mycobacteroides abscessus subsp. bolletii]SKS59926.1 Uncharacterised protein [Mycobacteroides abscessus subsp. bolletii]
MDRLTAQRELVFPGGRLSRYGDPADELRPFVGTGIGQVGKATPYLRKLQRRGAAEPPQGTLLGRDGVALGDVLCAAGDYPDGSTQLSCGRRAEQSACSAQNLVLDPQQRLCRGVALARFEGRDMHDAQRRILGRRRSQHLHELCLVGIRHR